nr:TPA_asm: capsid protein [Aedes partiti-like virus 1]
MESEKFILSESDSDGASPHLKTRRLEEQRKRARIGKGAKERRQDKFREFRNNQVYQSRLASCQDPQNLFTTTTNLEELEAKFRRWDEILSTGGTIYDSGETGGPILIETEPATDVQQYKNELYVSARASGVETTTYYNIPDDEDPASDDDVVDVVLSSYSLLEEPQERKTTEYVEVASLGMVDTDALPPLQMNAIDLDNLRQKPLYADLSTGKLFSLCDSPRPARQANPDPEDSVMEQSRTVRYKGKEYVISSQPRPPSPYRPMSPELEPIGDPGVVQSHRPETMEIEVFRKYGDKILMWHCKNVYRVVHSAGARANIQFHPLTRRELFLDWRIRVCVYRPDSLGDYVKEVVQVV